MVGVASRAKSTFVSEQPFDPDYWMQKAEKFTSDQSKITALALELFHAETEKKLLEKDAEKKLLATEKDAEKKLLATEKDAEKKLMETEKDAEKKLLETEKDAEKKLMEKEKDADAEKIMKEMEIMEHGLKEKTRLLGQRMVYERFLSECWTALQSLSQADVKTVRNSVPKFPAKPAEAKVS